ncbi:ferrochelatase [Rickettsia felis]
MTYQSRVGPIEWLKPNTEDEIELAGKLKKRHNYRTYILCIRAC